GHPVGVVLDPLDGGAVGADDHAHIRPPVLAVVDALLGGRVGRGVPGGVGVPVAQHEQVYVAGAPQAVGPGVVEHEPLLGVAVGVAVGRHRAPAVVVAEVVPGVVGVHGPVGRPAPGAGHVVVPAGPVA